MCDMCRNEEDNSPAAARPLNKYDYMAVVFGTLYNISLALMDMFRAFMKAMYYQSSLEAKHANDWAKLSQDLERLEADNG
jgi:hypothetical protein